MQKSLWQYYDERKGKYLPLFQDIIVEEGLILQHSSTGIKLFVVHGHQGDPINDQLWKLGRFLVRYLLRTVQIIGIKKPCKSSGKPKQEG